MPNPAGLNTTVLHMKYVEPNATATPLQGTLTFTPSPSPILFPNENVIVAGTETVTLDANGEGTIELISTDQAGENPQGWVYSVTEKLIGQKQRTFNILLPYNNGVTVELADIEPTDVAPNYIPVVGPVGAPGLVQSVNGKSAAFITLVASDLPDLVPTAQLGAANGVATLDGSSLVPLAQIPVLTTAKIPDLSATYVLQSAVEAANGIATLDGSGKVKSTELNLASSAPPSVGAAAVGTSTNLARQDHTHAGVDLVNAQTIAGAKNFSTSLQTAQFGVGVAPGTNGVRAYIKSAADETVFQVENTVTATNPLILLVGFDTGTTAFAAKMTSDSVGRVAIKSSGNIEMGPGTGARDTTLSRSAANEFTVSGQLVLSSAAPTAAGHATRKDYVDNNFSSLTGAQTISGVKTFTGAPVLQQSAAGTTALKVQVAGDTTPRLTIGADGTLSFGPGNAAADLVISRSGAAALAINNAVRVTQAATASVAYATIIGGDTFDRYRIYMDGKNEWGSGGAARDVNLYRAGAGLLQIDQNLTVGGTFSAGNFPSGAWTSWTPTWTTTTGNNTPNFGNAVVNAKYLKIGRTVFWKMDVSFGSTTNFGAAPSGSDNWLFSMPFSAADSSTAVAGHGTGYTGSSLSVYMCALFNDATHILLATGSGSPGATSGAAGYVDSVSPYTWTTSHTFHLSGQYEATS